jgi:2-oxoisovalerate dehydrogenase E1 component alpha subunit
LQDTAAEIDAATAAFLALPPQSPETIFDHTFAQLPAELAAQRAAALAVAGAPERAPVTVAE